jgi:Amt family ammonium transporter
VGIFANGQYGLGWTGVVRDDFVKRFGSDGVRGILHGDPSQLVMQLIDAGVVAVFGFCMAYVWFKVSNLIVPLRVSAEVEIQGLDAPEMGLLGYPEFALPSRGQGAQDFGVSSAGSLTGVKR